MKKSLLELSDEDAPDFDGYLFESVPIFQGEAGMTILPLYAAPQYAEQVTDWIWQAFGDGLPQAFPHYWLAARRGHVPLTIAWRDERLVGAVGLWLI